MEDKRPSCEALEQGLALGEVSKQAATLGSARRAASARRRRRPVGINRHPPLVQQRKTNCATPSSELCDDEGVAARRESGVPADAGEHKQQLKPYDGRVVGREFDGRLMHSTPGAAGRNAVPP